MITNQMIARTIDDMHRITRIDFAVYDLQGNVVAKTMETPPVDTETALQFAASAAESQEVGGCHFFKVQDEDSPEYILISYGAGEDSYLMGKVVVASLEQLMEVSRDRLDRNTFIQNLLLDNLLLVDIYNKARKLHVDIQGRRMVYIVETNTERDPSGMEIMRGLFGGNSRDFITAVDETSIIYVQELSGDVEDDYQEATNVAAMICDMMDTEGVPNVRVAFGTAATEIQYVSRSFKEARMALDVGKIFYGQKRIHSYRSLGIGRLIYQLPVNLCEMFMDEVFTRMRPEEFDEETLITINSFFENNLNVSETARQLFVHSNTLVYRLEKLEKSTGLDIRNFEDALTVKIALMVVSYMRYIGKE